MENQFRGSGTYVASEELLKVTNIAIALQKPLLVKGEPGTGKTVWHRLLQMHCRRDC